MMLCNFNYTEEISITSINGSSDNYSNKSVDEEIKVVVVAGSSVLQYLLSFWVGTLFFEEIRQVF